MITHPDAPVQKMPTALTGQELIPDVVRSWPTTRSVLDRYGLHCCGGPFGPTETLAYFSRAHSVDLTRLLHELEEARVANTPLPTALPTHDPAGTIYRRFFVAAIAITLTAGATWGAFLLLHIGREGSFQAVSPYEVNAHGHVQIFGWVGLFVMGFAYQAFPRFKHSALEHPRWALASFPIYLTGLCLRTGSEALQPSPTFVYVGLAGSALEILGIAIFAWIVVATLLKPTARNAAGDAYIISAVAWFLVQALQDAALFVLTSQAGSTEELVRRIATWQTPLRDAQIHGFALLMILGVSQRFLPGMIGLERIPEKLSRMVLWLLNTAVLGEIVGFVGRRLTSSAIFPWILTASTWMLLGGVTMLVWRFGILHRRAEPDRSVKFLRAAYAWLLVSLAMLVLYPVYRELLAVSYSHAYLGATRHAITVGFVSMMILGVASKVIPTLAGVPATSLSKLWVPFLLINTGCTLRVFCQILTDSSTAAFPLAASSGILEVTGLAIWGIGMVHLMIASARGGCPLLATAGARPAAMPVDFIGQLRRP